MSQRCKTVANDSLLFTLYAVRAKKRESVQPTKEKPTMVQCVSPRCKTAANDSLLFNVSLLFTVCSKRESVQPTKENPCSSNPMDTAHVAKQLQSNCKASQLQHSSYNAVNCICPNCNSTARPLSTARLQNSSYYNVVEAVGGNKATKTLSQLK